MLKECALDPSLSVRETARYYLKLIGMSDFAGFYRAKLSDASVPSSGLILGIGETGSSADASLVTGFLRHSGIRTVKAAMRGIAMLSPDKLTRLLLPFIADDRPGVSKTAGNYLRNRSFELDEAKLTSLFKNSTLHHARRNALHLLCSINHWDSISYIIEACAQEDPLLRGIGFHALEKWFARGVHAPGAPSAEQSIKAKQALDLHGAVFDPAVMRQLEFFLKQG
jgi:hypothetical protein